MTLHHQTKRFSSWGPWTPERCRKNKWKYSIAEMIKIFIIIPWRFNYAKQVFVFICCNIQKLNLVECKRWHVHFNALIENKKEYHSHSKKFGWEIGCNFLYLFDFTIRIVDIKLKVSKHISGCDQSLLQLIIRNAMLSTNHDPIFFVFHVVCPKTKCVKLKPVAIFHFTLLRFYLFLISCEQYNF